MAEPGVGADARRPTATVIVCTRDRPELLAGCLGRVDAAMAATDELIVVDAGSDPTGPDPTVSGDPTVSLGGPARWLRADRAGKSHQLNLGVRAAVGDVVVITDDDCRVPRRWVDAMVAEFGDPRVGVAFGPVRGLTSVPGPPLPLLAPGPAPIEHWVYAHGASMAVRRTALVEVGGFDERLGPGAPVHGEEADLVLRLQERGWACRVADAPVVEHAAWRNDDENSSNVMIYERGSGALLGAALRRSPRRHVKVFAVRLKYQAQLWGQPGLRGWSFGPRTLAAFCGGVLTGLRLPPRRWL